MPELEDAIAAELGRQWGGAWAVRNLARFHGGAARETYRFDAERDGERLGLVLRRDPPASLIDTSRAVEFHAMARAHGGGVPAPEPLFACRIGSEGFVMREVPGGRAPGLFEPEPYGDGARTGAEAIAALGRLHALKPNDADRAVLPVQGAMARLEHWADTLERHKLRAEPVAAAAIRWLRAHPPADVPPALVHGDYRSGNLLVGEDGALLAALDWEMAHLGDPMEDLAWFCDPLWSHGSGRPAAMLPMEEGVRAWEAASGRAFARADWAWWRLFAGVMGLAIWISSAAEAARGASDPVLIFAGLLPYRFHNAQVAAMLAELEP